MGGLWKFRTGPASVPDAQTPKEPTTEEKLKALTERVAAIEKDIRLWPESSPYSFTSLFMRLYEDGTNGRPKVGEAVRMLMQHLGLTFEAGKTAPDKLVKAKKTKKK